MSIATASVFPSAAAWFEMSVRRCAVLGCLWAATSTASLAGELTVELQDIGGFRRGYVPASTRLDLPAAVPRDTPFCLLADGHPIAAQFRPNGDDQSTAIWWLDFITPVEPWQHRTFQVRYGPEVEPSPEPERGHQLRITETTYEVQNAPYITWTIPRDLSGLLTSVAFAPVEHIRPGAAGLVLVDHTGGRHALGGSTVQSRVVRSGTTAVALRFEGSFDNGPLADVAWTVDLVLPSPVSWVEVSLHVRDPQRRVKELGTELKLALDAPSADAPTLADFGAWTFLYAALAEEEAAELGTGVHARRGKGGAHTEPNCAFFRGPADGMVRVAEAQPPAATGEPASAFQPDGWLHIMDRTRCLALAVADFGSSAGDRLRVTAEGAVGVWRTVPDGEEAAGDDELQLKFWLHFVGFPPQHTAATSPRMMQTPPSVTRKVRGQKSEVRSDAGNDGI